VAGTDGYRSRGGERETKRCLRLAADAVKMNPQESARNNATGPFNVLNRTDASTIATDSQIDRSEESLVNHDVALDGSVRINHGTMMLMPPPLPPIQDQAITANAFASHPPPPQYPNSAQAYPPVIPYAAPPNYIVQYPPVYPAPAFPSNYLGQYPPVPQYAAPAFQSNYMAQYQPVLPFIRPAFQSNSIAQMPHATLPPMPTQAPFPCNSVVSLASRHGPPLPANNCGTPVAAKNPPFAPNGTIPVSLPNANEPWPAWPTLSSPAKKAEGRPSKPVPNSWANHLAQLKEYKAIHGHCDVPQRYPLNVKLGRWVKDQRTFKVQSKLSQERIDQLEELGFHWKVKTNEIFWEKQFDLLVSYKKIHGDCNVVKVKTNDDKLLRWVDRQRQAKKNGKLSKERLEKLNNLGFTWSGR
jgi:hypothetical protein